MVASVSWRGASKSKCCLTALGSVKQQKNSLNLEQGERVDMKATLQAREWPRSVRFALKRRATGWRGPRPAFSPTGSRIDPAFCDSPYARAGHPRGMKLLGGPARL